MIRRPPRSTRVRSSAASDVYKRQKVCTVCTKVCTKVCNVCTGVCTQSTKVCTLCTEMCTRCTKVCTLCTEVCALICRWSSDHSTFSRMPPPSPATKNVQQGNVISVALNVYKVVISFYIFAPTSLHSFEGWPRRGPRSKTKRKLLLAHSICCTCHLKQTRT